MSFATKPIICPTKGLSCATSTNDKEFDALLDEIAAFMYAAQTRKTHEWLADRFDEEYAAGHSDNAAAVVSRLWSDFMIERGLVWIFTSVNVAVEYSLKGKMLISTPSNPPRPIRMAYWMSSQRLSCKRHNSTLTQSRQMPTYAD